MKNALFILFIFTMFGSYAQVGIGTTTPDNSAALEISSTSKGLLLPRLTRSQIEAIASPATGLMVFCSDCSPVSIYFYDGAIFKNTNGTGILGFELMTGAGGATWLDRNLGATQAATSLTDANAYGDLYQWGRTTDGHQIRTSSTRSGPVVSGSEGSRFVVIEGNGFSSGGPLDLEWLTVSDGTRWNGTTKGIHDPCPSGYRVPTAAEWNQEVSSWSSSTAAQAFTNLKLTFAGLRLGHNYQDPDTSSTSSPGFIIEEGDLGDYWSSTLNSSLTNSSDILRIASGGTAFTSSGRVTGLSVRCIQE